jgi:AraC-like DNA-binding protein
MKKSLILSLLMLISIQWVYSQKAQIFHIPDSLKNKTYKELSESQSLTYYDTIKDKIYITAYLHKAKNENDTIKIANAYTQFVSVYTNQSALRYCDSIINLTKKIEHFVYPGYGYMLKGISYYNLGSYEKALDNYLIAHQYAVKNKNLEQLLYIKNIIGRLKNFWGNYNEALGYFKIILQQLNQQNNVKFKNEEFLYFNALIGISNSYIFAKNPDSALIYAKIGIQKFLPTKNDYYYSFVSQTGIIAYYQNNFDMAIDSLDKALPFETSLNGLLNDHYYRGQIYWKRNNNAKAFYHFTKADSIYNLTKDAVPEVRDIQEYLVTYYKKNNDIVNQLKYIDRLLYIDSIINSNYRNLNEKLVKEYDTPLLIAEKQRIINDLKKEEKKSSFIILGLISLILIALTFIIWFYKKQRIYKERFNNLLLDEEKIPNTNNQPEKSVNELTGISKEIVNTVLLELEKFEIEKIFLDNKITLNSLAKTLNSNSNYLSKIINFYKKKNFSSYISDLRIDFCVNQLKFDKNCRKYSIKAIASEIGFNNAESFSKAFYKKTGLYPSYFIKKLEKLK